MLLIYFVNIKFKVMVRKCFSFLKVYNNPYGFIIQHFEHVIFGMIKKK